MDPASNDLRRVFNVFAMLIESCNQCRDDDREKKTNLYVDAARQIRDIVQDLDVAKPDTKEEPFDLIGFFGTPGALDLINKHIKPIADVVQAGGTMEARKAAARKAMLAMADDLDAMAKTIRQGN